MQDFGLVGDNSVTIQEGLLRWSDLLAVPDELERAVSAAGISVAPVSRIDRYRRLIQRHFVRERDGIQMGGSDSAKLLLCAGSELRVLRFIVSQLGHHEHWRGKLGGIFAGAEHPDDDRKPAARSLQAELNMAARLSWLGLRVEPGEPDIITTWNGWRFGVAVKRIRSEQQYHTRLHEGFAQIRRGGFPGMVAMDLSQILWNDQKPVFTNQPEALSIVTLKLMQDFLYARHARPEAMRRNDLPFGLIYFANTTARTSPDGRAQFCTGHIFAAFCEEKDPRQRRVLRLQRLLQIRSAQHGHSVTRIPMV